jgi:predicted nicotinamide N-methyase
MALRAPTGNAFWVEQRVLELGCGTGISGLGAALLGATVVLTDLPDVIALAQTNIEANQAAINNAGGSCCVSTLDWTQPSSLIDECVPSIVLAADCIYSVGAIAPIMKVVIPLLRKEGANTTLLWCHKRRHEHVDVALRAAWEEAGLHVQVVPKESLHPMHRSVTKIDLYVIRSSEALVSPALELALGQF